MRFKITCLFIYIAILLVLSSCENDDMDSNFDKIILSNQDKVLVGAANNFGFDLLKLSQANKSDENIIISPLEIASNLNLLLNGSSGSTYEIINSYINPSNLLLDEINNSYRRILESIENLSDEKLIMVNGFWFWDLIGVKSHFENISDYFYKTTVDSIDFSNSEDYNRIGEWISSNSENQLTFTNRDFSEQTQSFLINGFACNLNFKYSFKEKTTEAFRINDSDSINIPVLKVVGDFKTYKHDYFTLVEIPYSNSSFSLIMLLPNEDASLNSILPLINSSIWDYWISYLKKIEIELTVPELNLSESIDMAKYLVNSPFDFLITDTYDFTGITNNENFRIDNLFSQSNFKIQDKNLSFTKSNEFWAPKSTQSFQFQINKPFLFAIKENSSNLVLSVGIIKKPINN